MEKKYKITDKKGTLEENGGQIIKTYLEEQGKNSIDHKYVGKHKGKQNIDV